MTLAPIVLFALFGNVIGVPGPPAGHSEQSTTQQAPADSQGQAPDTRGKTQTTPPASNSTPSASTPSQGSSTQPKKPVRRRRRKKNTSAPPCDTNNAKSGSSAQTGGTQNTGADAGVQGQNAAKPCPTPKTIVRHGGTSEPSIQLAGDQPPKERENTNQLLNAT